MLSSFPREFMTLAHLSTILPSINAITSSWISLSGVYSGHSYPSGPTLITEESQDVFYFLIFLWLLLLLVQEHRGVKNRNEYSFWTICFSDCRRPTSEELGKYIKKNKQMGHKER